MIRTAAQLCESADCGRGDDDSDQIREKSGNRQISCRKGRCQAGAQDDETDTGCDLQTAGQGGPPPAAFKEQRSRCAETQSRRVFPESGKEESERIVLVIQAEGYGIVPQTSDSQQNKQDDKRPKFCRPATAKPKKKAYKQSKQRQEQLQTKSRK